MVSEIYPIDYREIFQNPAVEKPLNWEETHLVVTPILPSSSRLFGDSVKRFVDLRERDSRQDRTVETLSNRLMRKMGRVFRVLLGC